LATQVIGLTGYAQAGKDTAGAVLVAEYGFTRVSFADGVRSMALTIDPWVSAGAVRLSGLVRAIGWERAKNEVAEVRRLLQKIGTEGVRDHIGPESWVNAAKLKVDAVDGPVVITDVRFPNEARAIREWDGYMLRIVRLTEDDLLYDNGLGRDHPSEAQVESLPTHGTIYARNVDHLQNAIRKVAVSQLNIRPVLA
jgi:hypothetical protein